MLNKGLGEADSRAVRGQKLPIFLGSGLPGNEFANLIVQNAGTTGENEQFVIVFGAMGLLCSPFSLIFLLTPQPDNPFQTGPAMTIFSLIGFAVGLVFSMPSRIPAGFPVYTPGNPFFRMPKCDTPDAWFQGVSCAEV